MTTTPKLTTYCIRMRRLENAFKVSSFRVLATSREDAERITLQSWGGSTVILPPRHSVQTRHAPT